jgi:hypothetical protein
VLCSEAGLKAQEQDPRWFHELVWLLMYIVSMLFHTTTHTGMPRAAAVRLEATAVLGAATARLSAFKATAIQVGASDVVQIVSSGCHRAVVAAHPGLHDALIA